MSASLSHAREVKRVSSPGIPEALPEGRLSPTPPNIGLLSVSSTCACRQMGSFRTASNTMQLAFDGVMALQPVILNGEYFTLQ